MAPSSLGTFMRSWVEFLKDQDVTQSAVAKWVKNHPQPVWMATYVYFVYVVLGGVHHGLHKHIYTGDENESLLTRLTKGQPVVFRKDVYEEFFSFKHYFTTYRIHVLTAGAWLISGAYNLRNPPEFAGKDAATGFARYPMAVCGVYDCISLFIAMQKVVQGDVVGHKRWMIRNFGVGAGSIWARVFAIAWALTDLNFMKRADLYRKMNNVVLCCGFAQGIIFSEWWLAKTRETRNFFAGLQALNVILCALGARQVYKELRDEAQQDFKKTGIHPEFGMF